MSGRSLIRGRTARKALRMPFETPSWVDFRRLESVHRWRDAPRVPHEDEECVVATVVGGMALV